MLLNLRFMIFCLFFNVHILELTTVHEKYIFARNICKAEVWLSNEGALVIINSAHTYKPCILC